MEPDEYMRTHHLKQNEGSSLSEAVPAGNACVDVEAGNSRKESQFFKGQFMYIYI